jgi:hypothetical protein
MTMKEVRDVLDYVAAKRLAQGCDRRSIIEELAAAAAARCSDVRVTCALPTAAETTAVLFDAGVGR